jgi:hypothetical protein
LIFISHLLLKAQAEVTWSEGKGVEKLMSNSTSEASWKWTCWGLQLNLFVADLKRLTID